MKKYIVTGALAAIFALGLFAAVPTQASAAVAWNGYPADCPTVGVANYTTKVGMSGCWGTSVSANAGDTINVHIYYHNTGTSVADNTILRLSNPVGSQRDFNFIGYISSGAAQGGGSATVHLSSTQTLTLNHVYWYPDKKIVDNGMPSGQSPSSFIGGSGLNIGSIYPPSDCGSTGDTYCHSGYMTASFIVSNVAVNNCAITSFGANPTVINDGGTSTLSWNTTGCTSVTISGPGVSGGQALSGNTNTGVLHSSATYTINASGAGGSAPSQSTSVAVNAAAQNCTVSSFYANPTSVTTGNSSTLSWNTTNCTNVTISGPTGTLSTLKSGSVSTGALTNTSVFTINASGATGPASYPSQTVTVTGGGTGGNCTVTSFVASPSSIASGATSTLVWNTTGCTSATVYGTGVSSSLLNGSIQTPQLYSNTTYTITAYGSFGGTPVTQNVVVNMNNGAGCQISFLTASPTTVTAGGVSTISWSTIGCVSATVSGMGVSSSSLSGSTPTPPLNTNASYTLMAFGASGVPVTQTVAVTVNSASACAINSFTANPATVASGNLSTLSWVTPGCTNVMISGGTNFSNTPIYSNSISTQPLYNTTTYTLSAYGAGSTGPGTISQPATQTTIVTVQNTQSLCAINSFYGSPTLVPQGGSATLYWNTTGCTNVSVSGPNVSSSAFSNSMPIGPIYGTNTYTITASSTSGNPVTQSTTVTANTIQNNNTAPLVTTSPATNILDTSATLNGYITNGVCAYPTTTQNYSNNNYNNGSNCANSPTYTSYYFLYGTSQYGLSQQTPTQTLQSGNSGNAFSYVSNLLPNTTYYFQLVGTNNYGTNSGVVLSFVTTGSANVQISAVTTVATNITSGSARLNGLVYGPQNYPISTYFEYGTSPSLGTQTGLQTVSTYTATNYFSTISIVPNTTYYYRIVALSNGQTFPGATVSFTSGSNTIVNPPTVITRIVNVGTGGGSAYVALTITDQTQNVFPGNSINYLVTYQNISTSVLSNAVLDVILPTGVTYQQSSQGVLTTNNTVAINLGTLAPNAPAQTINITGLVNITDVPGNNFVTTATLAFTTPSRAQDSAIAYVLNNVSAQNSLAGLALFGNGFFPNTLLGWIILIGLILILIFIARYFYHRANAERVVAAPAVTHVHYDTAPAPSSSMNNHGGYPGNNLPH